MEIRPKYVYCVVKSATLRKRDGTKICNIPFGSQFHELCRMSDGTIYGEVYNPDYRRGYTKYRGYVQAKGFTKHKVVDMSYLYYRNATGKRIPTATRYKGEATGWIAPDETIHVIAAVGDWMLTGKGWTKSEWLEKKREVFDQECLKNLVYAIITQTVTDYKKIIRKLQSGSRYVSGELPDAITELRLIRKWFKDGDYLKVFEDSLTGEERLQCLDKELGVTEEWIKEILSKKNKRRP